MPRATVLIVQAEISLTHKLEMTQALAASAESCFHLAAGQNFQRSRDSDSPKSFCPPASGSGIRKQIVIQAHLGVHRGGGIHPVDGGAFDLAAVGWIAATATPDRTRTKSPSQLPASSLTQPVQVIRYAPFRRHSGPPGNRRLYFGTGVSKKSSASIHKWREKRHCRGCRHPDRVRIVFHLKRSPLCPSG